MSYNKYPYHIVNDETRLPFCGGDENSPKLEKMCEACLKIWTGPLT